MHEIVSTERPVGISSETTFIWLTEDGEIFAGGRNTTGEVLKDDSSYQDSWEEDVWWWGDKKPNGKILFPKTALSENYGFAITDKGVASAVEKISSKNKSYLSQ